jgi:hypothetical protein
MPLLQPNPDAAHAVVPQDWHFRSCSVAANSPFPRLDCPVFCRPPRRPHEVHLPLADAARRTATITSTTKMTIPIATNDSPCASSATSWMRRLEATIRFGPAATLGADMWNCTAGISCRFRRMPPTSRPMLLIAATKHRRRLRFGMIQFCRVFTRTQFRSSPNRSAGSGQMSEGGDALNSRR